MRRRQHIRRALRAAAALMRPLLAALLVVALPGVSLARAVPWIRPCCPADCPMHAPKAAPTRHLGCHAAAAEQQPEAPRAPRVAPPGCGSPEVVLGPALDPTLLAAPPAVAHRETAAAARPDRIARATRLPEGPAPPPPVGAPR